MAARNPREALRLALGLAAVAGFVDAVGYVTLHGLFVAHMSGNSVKLGVRLGAGSLVAAEPVAFAVVLFVTGVAAGTVAAELAARRRIRSVAAAVLLVQESLILAFMLYGRTLLVGRSVPGRSPGGFYLLAALAVVSMGMQTAALRQLGGREVRTTYVTGVLTSLTQAAVNWAFWLHDGSRRDEERSFLARVLGLGSRAEARSQVALLGSVWIGYAAGAVLGSYCDGRIALWSLGIPLAIVAVVIARDLVRPIEL